MDATALPPPPPLRSDWALFIDVDGTLLEIAPTPDEVRADSELLALLAILQRMSGGALALLSGRRIADLDRIIWPLHLPAAGIHGLERRRWDASLVGDGDDGPIAALRTPLRRYAEMRPGLWVEDKGPALALHYRAAPEHEDDALRFARALLAESDPALRMIAGKMVVEFHARHADKGSAIAAFMTEPPFRGRRPLFVGDDVTDEDGFRAVRRLGGIAVRVGPPRAPGRTEAEYQLSTVAALREWLQQTVSAGTAAARFGGTADTPTR
jgi:trehalose 6-phosphate phosphatase